MTRMKKLTWSRVRDVQLGYSMGEWDGFGEPADYSFLEATEGDSGAFMSLGVSVKISTEIMSSWIRHDGI